MLTLFGGCSKPIAHPASRLHQPKGAFSFVTPEGWHRTQLAGIDFIVVSTDADYGIQPNIFVKTIQPDTIAHNTASEQNKSNQQNLHAYELQTQSHFTTRSHLAGIKTQSSFHNKQGLPLVRFEYFIQDNHRVIAISCTCAEAVQDTYEPIFDEAIHSLQTETNIQ